MSSSIDWIECPKCGKSASREQYTSGEVFYNCRHCGWNGEGEEEDDVLEV